MSDLLMISLILGCGAFAGLASYVVLKPKKELVKLKVKPDLRIVK
jgi:hypothetical protein